MICHCRGFVCPRPRYPETTWTTLPGATSRRVEQTSIRLRWRRSPSRDRDPVPPCRRAVHRHGRGGAVARAKNCRPDACNSPFIDRRWLAMVPPDEQRAFSFKMPRPMPGFGRACTAPMPRAVTASRGWLPKPRPARAPSPNWPRALPKQRLRPATGQKGCDGARTWPPGSARL
jgi:hypothetical protein